MEERLGLGGKPPINEIIVRAEAHSAILALLDDPVTARQGAEALLGRPITEEDKTTLDIIKQERLSAYSKYDLLTPKG